MWLMTKALVIIEFNNHITPEDKEHIQHLLDGDTKHRPYSVEVVGKVDDYEIKEIE